MSKFTSPRRLVEELGDTKVKELFAEGWRFNVPTAGTHAGEFEAIAPDGRTAFALTPLLAYERLS